MVPGVASNTSDSFPMITELSQKVYEFTKSTCQDLFFDVLSIQLSELTDVARFFKMSFQSLQTVVAEYFRPLEGMLATVACSKGGTILERASPLRNVLSKTYQSNWRQIQRAAFSPSIHESILLQLMEEFSLDPDQTEEALGDYLTKAEEIIFMMWVSEPSVILSLDEFGQKDVFSQSRHECLDGFLKSKEACIIVLPSIFKLVQINSAQNAGASHAEVFDKKELLVKASVLSWNYEF